MASKSERLITEALGSPSSNQGGKISFSGTTASGVLTANTTYRLAATEDCYVKIEADNAAADSSDMLMFGGVPEVFVTTGDKIVVNVLQKDTAGTLHYTPMVSRGQ